MNRRPHRADAPRLRRSGGATNASGAEISLTLPVFRPAAIIEKRQSATVVLQATSELEATRQELIHRVGRCLAGGAVGAAR